MPKMPTLFRLSLLSIIVLVFALVFSNYTISQSKSDSEVEEQFIQKEDSEQLVVDETPHNVVAAYYDTQNFPTAKLLLNNKDIVAREIRPTLYNLDGGVLEIAPVMVGANSHLMVDLNEWTSIGGENFQRGSLKLFYTGKDLNIGSQIYLAHEQYSLSFEERLVEIGKFDSRRLESIWVMPNNQADVKIILSNTTAEMLSVTAKLSREPRQTGNLQNFTLLPHQTRVLNLRTDFTGGSAFANSPLVGLSLEHTGEKSALKAHGQVKEASIGYSNIIAFNNPNTAKSSELHGTGLHVGLMGNEQVVPVVAIKNVGETTATVRSRIPYTRTDGTTGIVKLPPVKLRAGEFRLLNTVPVVERSQQEQIEIAGIEIEYNTVPGSVIVNTQSASLNRNQVFRVPMFDPYAQVSSTGGYPWLIDETSRTVSYIKNTTNLEQEYVAYLTWDGGEYMIGLKKLAPQKTIQIDVQKIRDEQILDERGNTIPLSVNSGQIKWTMRSQEFIEKQSLKKFELVGRSEQIDLVKGISSSYACQNCCQKSAYGWISSGGITEAEVGTQIPFAAYEQGTDCYGFPYGPYQLNNANVDWDSSNNNIATVSNLGLVTIVGVGNFEIDGHWWVTRTAFDPYCPLLTGQTKLKSKPDEKENAAQNLTPDCSICFTESFRTGSDVDISAKPGIQKIQYQELGTSNYIDITGTLYVLKGTTVNFRAIPNPNNATFPNGKPTWSGTSGITGTGQTSSVTFNTKSNNTTDYKTVTASVISPVFVNVVVYELIGTVNPQDFFYGRSTDRYGLLEKANLGFIASPNVTAQQIGTLRWAIQQGLGSVSNDTNLNGAGIFTADRNIGAVQLVLNIENGPSKGVGFLPDLLTVVAPTNAYMVKNPEVPVLHCQNYSSVGFQGFVYLNPTDVSFSNLYFQEGFGTIQSQGYYQNQNGLTHDPTGIGFPITSCNIITGCQAFYDTVYTLNWTGPFSAGTLAWPIEWKYGFSDSDPIQSYVLFTYGVHSSSADNQGTATISKASSGSFTKMVSESTSGTASLNPCIYPVVNP